MRSFVSEAVNYDAPYLHTPSKEKKLAQPSFVL
jgi:hypothetical protein